MWRRARKEAHIKESESLHTFTAFFSSVFGLAALAAAELFR
jgi:hypothetical protein